jgi:mRNA-degrading endonuclease toxin of MazEF toxin-antitoxin module
MLTGTVVIVSFPNTDLVSSKARPAAVVTETDDSYKDVIVSMITSVLPTSLNKQQILIHPSRTNNLRTTSVIKVSRLVTVEREKIVAAIGKLDDNDLQLFKEKFKSLVDN